MPEDPRLDYLRNECSRELWAAAAFFSSSPIHTAVLAMSSRLNSRASIVLVARSELFRRSEF